MDFLSSFKWLLCVSRVFGIAPYKLEKSKHRSQLLESGWAVFYTKVLFLAFTSSTVMLFVSIPEHVSYLLHVPSKTAKIIFYSTFCANAFFMYVAVIRKRKLILQCNNVLNEPCSEKAFKKMAKFSRNLVLWYAWLHCSANGTSLSSKIPHFQTLDFSRVFQWAFLSLWSLPEDYFICQSMYFANVARFKFEQMNKKLREEEKSIKLKPKLRSLMKEDMSVKDYLDGVREVFQFNLFLHMSQLFMATISFSFEMIYDEIEKFHIGGFLTFILSRLMPVIFVYESTRKEAEKTANYVHELFLDNDDPSIKEEVEIFSLQLQHRKVEFNACGFFKLDFTLLYSMIGAVTTYIIILIQFQKEEPLSLKLHTKKITNCSVFLEHYSVEDVRTCLSDGASRL